MSVPARPGPAAGLSPLVPLAYLVGAASAYVAAALGVAWLAPELAGHYYHPRLLALAHTFTLGWVTLGIMGASYQLIPIVLERPIWSARLARWQLAVLGVGVAGLVAHFVVGTWIGLTTAAVLLAAGVACHLVNVGMTVRGGRTRWTFTTRLIAMGYGGLAMTTLFGLALAINRGWPFLPGDFFPTLHAHVHLALLGWVAPMILGVAARVYPMFLLAPAPGRGLSLLQAWGLGLGVPAVVAGLLGVPGVLLAGALAVTVAAGGHMAWVIAMARTRKRPGLDWGLRFVLTATAFLAPAAVVGLALAADGGGPRVTLAYAIVILGGWVSLTIVGMMLKIVPFLVWYHAYGSRAGREPVPTMAQLSWPRAEGFAYAFLTGGVVLLVASVYAGDPAWIRSAGLVLAIGALALAGALARILAHLVRARSPSSPPSPAGSPALADAEARKT